MAQQLFPHQDECIDKMFETTEKVNICKMFCGSGKTFAYTTYLDECIDHSGYNLVVIAFPRIDLVNQYCDHYSHLATRYSRYVISSNHESRSNVEGLKTFLRKKLPKMILVTHASLWEVLDTIQAVYSATPGSSTGCSTGVKTTATTTGVTTLDPPIDCVILDEAHHFNSKRNIAALSTIPAYRVFGFTATPAKCHPDPIYTYSYADARRDGRCKQFEIDLYNTDDPKTPENIYKGLVYLAETTKVKNILCFHAFSKIGDKNGKTSVATYQGLKPKIIPDVTSFSAGLKSHVITGTMKSIERSRVLANVAKAPSNQLNIVHTCNTVSEGIDTKQIGSVCFVDPKGSIISIIQAIGRSTRLDGTDNPARVFILNFGEQNLNTFSTLLGVLNFLYQDCPELYEAAVKNPEHLTKVDYKFHFSNVIFNENGGDMYKGKYIDELATPPGTAFVECGSKLEGEIVTYSPLNTNVDKWLYFYTDEETGEILDFIGESKKAPKKITKPKKFVKFTGSTQKVPRKPQAAPSSIDDILDEIWSTQVLTEDFVLIQENRDSLLPTEDDTIADFFKTDDWDSITPRLFKKYLPQILDPEVADIVYGWTRLDSIREMIETIKANNGELPAAIEAQGKLLSRVKAIKRGEEPTLPKLTMAEETVLAETLGEKWWAPKQPTGFYNKTQALVLSYLNSQNYSGLVELKALQSGRKSVPPDTERLLSSIDPKWRSLQPSTICDVYWNMNDHVPYDDTISIAPGSIWSDTKSLGCLERSKPIKQVQSPDIVTIPEEHAVMVTIFDFEDAIDSGLSIDSVLKAEIKSLYREKNSILLKFLKDRDIDGSKLMEYLR